MDKENKRRRGAKREATKCQSNDHGEKEEEEEFIRPPRRRSARLIAISRPKINKDENGEDEGNKHGDQIDLNGEGKELKTTGKTTPKTSKDSSHILIGGSSTSSSIHSSLFSFESTSQTQPDIPSSSSNSTPKLQIKQFLTKKPVEYGAEGCSKMLSDSSDGGEDEWEAMELLHSGKTEKNVVEVQLEGKALELLKSQTKNPLEERDAKEAEERAKWEHEMKLEIMRRRRELQENLHRVHFLGYVAHLNFFVNSLLRNSSLFVDKFNSLFPDSTPVLNSGHMLNQLQKIFKAKLRCQKDICSSEDPSKWCINEAEFTRHLVGFVERKWFNTAREIALLFFAYCAFVLELNIRLCVAFNPIPRLMNEPKSDNKPKTKNKTNELKKVENGKDTEKKKKIEVKRKIKKNMEEEEEEKDEWDESSSGDESAEDEGGKKKRRRRKKPVEVKRKKEERTKDGEEREEVGGEQQEEAYWNEYWDEVERRWICVDPFHETVDKPEQIEIQFGLVLGPRKMLYVLAMDNQMGVREIGAKYAENWLKLKTRKLRTDAEWIRKSLELKSFCADGSRARLEDAQIHEHLKSKPIPTTLVEHKNHPLYALKKDLLKFEAIYPADTPPIGHIGKQKYEVYPRSAVHKLEGSLNWIKESRAIKTGEKPYKVVTARPKLNIPKEKREPLTLDLFGYWQTEPYVPPDVSPDGRIPRNEFGNIYMYKEDMLPKGCVHLRLPGIYLLARRLDLEAVPAVIGWEFSGGFNHPIIDGCVVLRKDEEVLRGAWQQVAREKAAKEAKRAEERVWRNWRRLIRGKMLLERMRERFRE